jgi:Lrp/AsnC family transcriptional regulator, leucine-responsive regulatory protein
MNNRISSLQNSDHSDFDDFDRKILGYLTSNARLAVSDLARRIGLSPPSVHARLKNLEARGIVRGYHADVSPDAAGINVIAFIGIATKPFRTEADQLAFEGFFTQSANVIECHDCSGEHDYLVKVVAGNNLELRELLSAIRKQPNVVSTNTNIVLCSIKESAMRLMLPEGPVT